MIPKGAEECEEFFFKKNVDFLAFEVIMQISLHIILIFNLFFQLHFFSIFNLLWHALVEKKVVTLFEFLMHICGFTSEQTFLRLIDVWFMIVFFIYSFFLYMVVNIWNIIYSSSYTVYTNILTKEFDLWSFFSRGEFDDKWKKK